MDARIKLLLKKTRPLQLLFVVAAVVCLLVFLVFNFSLNDRAGAFEVRHAANQIEVPLSRSGLTDLSIEASGVRLEVGMVSSLSKPQVILAGEGYDGQVAKVDLEGTSCSIVLQGVSAKDVDALTMQVLLPQSDLRSVSIDGESLDLHVEDLRTNLLDVSVQDQYLGSSYAYFADIKADNMIIRGNDTPLRFYDNQVAALTVASDDGSITFLENDFERVDAVTNSGNVFCYDTRVKGQWNVQSAVGDITMLSKNLPYNMTITAIGDFDLGYDSRYWKDAEIIRYGDNNMSIATVGNNPDKIIQAASDGKIIIGQRERYSDLDPYAADYPFADTNPYLIERSTITK